MASVCLPLECFLHIITQLIAITDVMTTSSISSTVPTTVGTTILAMVMVDVTGTVEGVAGTLEVIETVLIVDVVKCVGVSKKYVPISGLALLTVGHGVMSELVTSAESLYTSDDCDDDVSAAYIDIVEQFMGITVSSERQHIVSPLTQLVQSLLLSNVMLMTLMSDGVSGSFT